MVKSTFSYMVKVSENPVSTYKSVQVEGSPIPDTYMDNRPVYIGNIHLDSVDSFIETASWADSDKDLSDDELYRLTQQEQDLIVTRHCEELGWFK